MSVLCSSCKRNVQPIVALDVDNTLGNWTGHFFDFLEKYRNVDQAEVMRWAQYRGDQELSEFLQMTKREYQDAKVAFRAGGFKRWMPLMGYPSHLPLLRHALNDCEVWITTTRPWQRLDNIDQDLREWLHRMRIPYNHILFDDHKYQVLASTVDPGRVVFVLDDDPEMFDEAQDMGLPVFFRKTNWTRGITRMPGVYTLADAAKHIMSNIHEWRKSHGD